MHVASWQRAYAGIVPDAYLASLSVAEREHNWRQLHEQQPAHLLVARDAGGVTGFVAFGASRDADAPAAGGEIWAIYVAPQAWSAGIGQRLLHAATEQLQSEGFCTTSLWVIAGNQRAMRSTPGPAGLPKPVRSSRSSSAAPLHEIRYHAPDR